MNGEFTGYVWNGSSLVAETNDNTITNLYTYGADGITTANINGTTNIYLKNVHGDVVGMTDTNGTLQKSYRYDAFGNEQNPDEADQNPFRYCGEYFDKETDNIYLRNRYYAPNIGRFITEDPHWNLSNMIYGDNPDEEPPIPDMDAITQSGNLYVYCMNNPLKHVDPNGEEGVAAQMLIDAFLGGGKSKDYSYNQEMVRTFYSSPKLNEVVDSLLTKFKNSGSTNKTYSGSLGFYGNDKNVNDFDLHLGVGKANYTMEFTKEVVQKRFLWKTWSETVYSVKITISDTYDFDEYREGTSLSNRLNNWGYDMQKKGHLTPYSWSITFEKKGL